MRNKFIINKMKKSERKKQRGRNFSQAEEVLLLQLVKAHKNILENKKSDAIIWKEKGETWKKLAKQFVRQIGINRTAKALKDKYENLKKNLKRKSTAEVADEKREIYQTRKSCVSPASEKIFTILGESATGLSKIFDSDCSVSNVSSTSTEQSNHETSLVAIDDVQETYEESEAVNLTETKSLNVNISSNNNKRNCSLEQEKIYLTRLQQDFYRNENIRAEEKHCNENRRAEEKHAEEQKSRRLKNELLELEIIEKKKNRSWH